MAASTITTTSADFTGNFNARARKTSGSGGPVTVMKAYGSGGTDFDVYTTLLPGEDVAIVNNGTNAFKLAAAVTGMVVKTTQ